MDLKWTCGSLKEASLTVRSEVDNAVATVGTRIHDSTLAAMDSLVGAINPQISQGVFWTRSQDPGSVVFDPDQRDFSGKTEGLQMTASNRLNSNRRK